PTGDGTTSVTGLSAQGYTCTITDANGCTKTQAVTITAPSAITSNIVSQTNVSCNGGSNGAASITASGGTSGYTYDWTPGNPTGDGTTSVTGLSAQGYTCTITDANGCTKTQAVTITAPSAISSSMVSQTNVACNGGSNGAATITASGGTGSLTYAWSPAPGAGQGTASISGLTAQGYTCTITDANSCTKTQAVTITAPSAISVTLVSQTNVACNGGSSGAASVSASGGTGTLTYNWNPGNPTGDGTASVTGLVAGNYSCTVTDANSCTATSTIFNITQPSALTATTTQTNVACFGNATGAASVNASGGTGSYTYTWSPSGGNAATAGSLISGNYTCTITDANSCSITKTFTVTQPSSGLSATTTQTNVACNGGNTAIASVSASGGTGSLNYTWTPSGGNASTASGLAAGNYTCTITDASSCSSIKTFTITEPAVLSTISSAGSVLCNGGTTTVTVSATGGTPAYTGTGTFTVGAGTYSYTVTDVNSCSATTTITINEPTALSVSSTAGSISCNGGATTVTVSASGGTAAYTGTGTFTVTAGTYSYTVTDANSCSSTTTVTISEPGLLAATAASGTIACSGGVTTVTVSATGGTPSYSGTGTFTATASASQYTYTVSDANGCTTDAYVTVTEPSPLVITANAASINCNGAATTVSVSASGGTPAYTGLGTFTATAGSYTYTVTDANSCSTSTVITINEPAAIMTTQSPTLCAGQTITVGSNTYSTSATYTDVLTAVNGCDSTVITNLTVNSPIDISTTSSGPTVSSNANGATYQWIDCDNGNAVMPGETNQTFTATVTGNYAVIITENGCSATSACVSVNITGVAAISFESTLSVYPNPFTNEFTITGNVKGTAVLYSLLGEKINEFTLEDKTQVINVSDLAPGIYYLQAGTKKIKIIKQ
ncbi:MAG: beta strand repeat-containing protein, partial [Bacteroidia bacterium]